MSYRLFLDDERYPSDKDKLDWVIARSSAEAQAVVESKGTPSFISYDHDLGGEDTSIVFIHWLIERSLNGLCEFPREYYVHSQNPIGSKNISGLIESFLQFIAFNANAEATRMSLKTL